MNPDSLLLSENKGNKSSAPQRLNLELNKKNFYKNMVNSCRFDIINYLNVLSLEDFLSVVKDICSDCDVEVTFKSLM